MSVTPSIYPVTTSELAISPGYKTNNFRNLYSTCLIKGCDVTINGGDNTKFDIASGTVIHTDNFTDPLNPTGGGVQAFPAVTGIPIAADPATLVFIDLNLTPIALVSPSLAINDIASARRDGVNLAIIQHPAGVITSIDPIVSTIGIDYIHQIKDLSSAVGAIRLSGLRIAPNGANLSLDRKAGIFYSQFYENYFVDKKNPSQITAAQETAFSFLPIWRLLAGGSDIGASVTVIDPSVYDDGTAVALDTEPQGIVNNNQAQNLRVYEVGGSGTFVIEYGQILYTTLSLAVESAFSEIHVTSGLVENTSLRAIISIRGGAADLSNVIDAVILNPPTDFNTVRAN